MPTCTNWGPAAHAGWGMHVPGHRAWRVKDPTTTPQPSPPTPPEQPTHTGAKQSCVVPPAHLRSGEPRQLMWHLAGANQALPHWRPQRGPAQCSSPRALVPPMPEEECRAGLGYAWDGCFVPPKKIHVRDHGPTTAFFWYRYKNQDNTIHIKDFMAKCTGGDPAYHSCYPGCDLSGHCPSIKIVQHISF